MMKAPGLVWDACSLLNLVATRRAVNILESLRCPSYVVKQVREEETLYLRPLPEEDIQGKLVAVDLSEALNKSYFKEVEITPQELELFVEFASQVDDGESLSMAVASCRDQWLATDDRRCIRVANEYLRPIVTVTTPEWLKYWSEQSAIDAATLANSIRNIEICARYQPHRTHPLKEWWKKMSQR